MKGWLIRQTRDLRKAARTLTSRAFWRSLADYYSPEQIAARLELAAQQIRRNTGQKPDPKLDERIQRRRDRQDR